MHKLLIHLNEIEYVEEFKLLQTNIKKSQFWCYSFKKELEKAFSYLTPSEQQALRRWVNDFVSDRIELKREVFSI